METAMYLLYTHVLLGTLWVLLDWRAVQETIAARRRDPDRYAVTAPRLLIYYLLVVLLWPLHAIERLATLR